jgi:hypothetical protein
LPSNAADAGVPAFSVEEAVAGLPCEISGSAADALPLNPVTATAAAIVTAEIAAAISRPGPRGLVRVDDMALPASIGADGVGQEKAVSSAIDHQKVELPVWTMRT